MYKNIHPYTEVDISIKIGRAANLTECLEPYVLREDARIWIVSNLVKTMCCGRCHRDMTSIYKLRESAEKENSLLLTPDIMQMLSLSTTLEQPAVAIEFQLLPLFFTHTHTYIQECLDLGINHYSFVAMGADSPLVSCAIAIGVRLVMVI